MVLNPAEERPDLLHCAGCGTAYLHGLDACPHCGLATGAKPPKAAKADAAAADG